jgi:glutamyl-tRNA(Gln) amidotransferase subunit E
VNVSVTGGTRIEIKGVPRIPNIPLLTYNEAMRQFNLLRLRDELHRRGITNESFSSKTEEVTKLLRKTRYQPLKNAISEGLKVNCVLLQGFKGLLRWQTQTDTFFSREISDRVRVVACLTTLPNIMHSDSPSETLASSEWRLLKKTAGATDDDTIVLVWGNRQDADTGANEVIIRAREATIGIPSETRQALRDGTNGFERILPGPDRMYPDTDLPPLRITQAHLAHIKTSVPLPFWENEAWYRTLGIPADVIQPLSFSPFASLFATAVKEWGLPPTLVAVTLIQFPKRVAKTLGRRVSFTIDTMREILSAYREGTLAKEGFLPVLMQVVGGREFSRTDLFHYSDDELAHAIGRSQQELSGITIRRPEQSHDILMGLLMTRVRGKIDGKTLSTRIDSIRTEEMR